FNPLRSPFVHISNRCILPHLKESAAPGAHRIADFILIRVNLELSPRQQASVQDCFEKEESINSKNH
ncbi:hypothetical protein PMAYCL1PPCAC_10317, partial [Pristionchus mayeri]